VKDRTNGSQSLMTEEYPRWFVVSILLLLLMCLLPLPLSVDLIKMTLCAMLARLVVLTPVSQATKPLMPAPSPALLLAPKTVQRSFQLLRLIARPGRAP
jgi:hypothetical protein